MLRIFCHPLLMEQDETLYEYKMASETYRFEAHSHEEAEKVRSYALIHFTEKLGPLFSIDAMVGPDLVQMPKGFVVKEESGLSS